ncbi:TPA: hypothetical protein N0F65_008314 [Lagenidium giganteum]|uniref:Uncharacterized protein n=1 Tax=Lagenidium giganteum TaxID=4803 RepID=A0AAV2YRB4_9STRA|nr:TPA: hypothetical protein N0F65_008314 [Lagenidium giganteum]
MEKQVANFAGTSNAKIPRINRSDCVGNNRSSIICC